MLAVDREDSVAPARTSWPGLAADLERLGVAAGRERRGRIAIASYEFTGVVRNGGIGTACTSLARALADDGHDVDLVFTGWADDPSDESFEHWQAHYRDLGVNLDRLDLRALETCDTVLYNAIHSLALYRRLRDRDRERPYDAIHFVESVGHGFYSLQAKRHGLAFERATTVVGVHSPRRWLAEAHGVPFDEPTELGDEFLERRSIELADVVVSPSAHMLDWLERRGVRVPERSYVQQYVTNFTQSPDFDGRGGPSAERGAGATVRELVFFGRLEPRKGLPTFCDALDLLAEGAYGDLRRVTFLGREVAFGATSSAEYIRGRADDWPWECDILSDLDREAALAYLRAPGRLAVMASSMDNSPNTVYEALGLGIVFLASRGGGTAELVHPDDYERLTYDPRDPEAPEIDPGDLAATRPRHTGRVLAARLERALDTPPRPGRFAADPDANREAHVRWHRGIAGLAEQRAQADVGPDAAQASNGSGALPLPAEVGVHDLPDMAGDAAAELLLLMDREVEPARDLAATLAAVAAACPEAGFVTTLGSFEVETPDGSIERPYVPVGGSSATGLLGNCFGAGVVVARRDALERIGALRGELPPDAGVAGLLARAALAGERVDVVPELLYRLPRSAAPGGSLSQALSSHAALAAYHHAFADAAARDVAGAARRAIAATVALRARSETAERAAQDAQAGLARAEAAERAAADAHARLAVVTSSRSWRLTGALRRAALAIRRAASLVLPGSR